jgi:integrase
MMASLGSETFFGAPDLLWREAAAASLRRHILSPSEQHAVLSAIPLPRRWIAEIALATGLRQREQWALLLSDLELNASTPNVVVRHGQQASERRVPLAGFGLEAMKCWLEHRAGRRQQNPGQLVFPGPAGRMRNARAAPLPEVRTLPKVLGRWFTWLDWRHTCAVSLLAGWWEPPRSIADVCRYLGHRDEAVTETYAEVARLMT